MEIEVLQTGRGPYKRSPGRERRKPIGAGRRLLRKPGKRSCIFRGGVRGAQPEAESLREPVAGAKRRAWPLRPLTTRNWNPLQHPPVITTTSIETTPPR